VNEYFEPLSDDELQDHLRLSLPPTNARAGWYIDDAAVLYAIDYLGIKLPVRIRFMTTKLGATLGTHYSRTDWHRITIAQNIVKAGKASEVLWHELVHCMQAEKFAQETGHSINEFHELEYKKLDGPWGATYRQNRLEIQANKIAAEKNINHQLCITTREV
jgi:hypothetical protein